MDHGRGVIDIYVTVFILAPGLEGPSDVPMSTSFLLALGCSMDTR